MAFGKAHTSFIMCHLASEGDVPFIFRLAKEKTRVTMSRYVLVSTCIIFFPFDSFHLSHIIFFCFEFFFVSLQNQFIGTWLSSFMWEGQCDCDAVVVGNIYTCLSVP